MNHLVKFAGHDPWDSVRPSSAGARAYDLFAQFGYDTMQVAKRMNITEAKAERLITIERSRRESLPNPYVREA